MIGDDGAARRLPRRQTAIEHADALMAHGAKHPPDPRCGEQAERVIDDQIIVGGEAQPVHVSGKGRAVGQHVRQIAVRRRHLVNIKGDRAGNDFASRQIRTAGKRPAGVDESRGAGRVQPDRLRGVYDRVAVRGHAVAAGSSSSQDGTGSPFSRRKAGL